MSSLCQKTKVPLTLLCLKDIVALNGFCQKDAAAWKYTLWNIAKQNQTSNQKAQEEYEQAMRAAKKQEFEKQKKERGEAPRLYQHKKMQMFKMWSQKTLKMASQIRIYKWSIF